jgi:gliding motility-associated-like protein
VSKTVNVYETHAYAGNDTIIAENQPLQLQASGGQYYNWSPSTGLSDDKISNPIATLARSTSFVLTAFTEAGCATTDTLNLKVFKGPSFYVPSAFSPNGDGKNDDFRFIAVGMSKIASFQVYNRYGQLVYSSTQVMKGWNGTLGGVEQPAGTYVWVISGVDLSGQSHFKKGTVVLIR